MYLFHLTYRVVKRTPSKVTLEVSNGRTYLIFVAAFVLLFQAAWILVPGLVLCFIVWTYSRTWTVDGIHAILREETKILWIQYDADTISVQQIEAISITETSGGESGPVFCACARLANSAELRLFCHPDPDETRSFLDLLFQRLPFDRREIT